MKTTCHDEPSIATPTRDFCPRWSYALAILLIAIAYRGLYLADASRDATFNTIYMDQEYHLDWAKAIVTGEYPPPYDQMENAPYFRAPLYPHFLALLVSIFGPNLTAIRIVQMIIGASSCAFAYAIACKCWGQRVGILAGSGCAFYWVLAYFDGTLLIPVLLVFLILLGVLLVFRAVQRNSFAIATAAGIVFGLASITRPNILVFFPLLGWWAYRSVRLDLRYRRAIFAAILVAGCAIPPTLVTLRNKIVGNDWVVVASQGGVNYFIGNNPQSNGMQAVVPGTSQTWWGGFEDTRRIAEEDAGRKLKPSEISSYWFSRSFSYIKSEPVDWLKLTFRKTVALVGDVELPNNEPYEETRKNRPSLLYMPLGFGLLAGLFCLSLPQMLLSVWRGPKLNDDGEATRSRFVSLILQFMAIYALTIVAFFVTGRFRVPLIPFVIMGSAVAISTIISLVHRRRMAAASLMLVGGLALVGLLRIDHFDIRTSTAGFAKLTRAQDLIDVGDYAGAIEILEAVRASKSVQAPEVYSSLIGAYHKRKGPNDKKAILSAVDESLILYPNDATLLWYACGPYYEAGRTKELASVLDRFLEQKPEDLKALYLAFNNALRLGERDKARDFLDSARSLAPTDPLVRRMIEQADNVGL